MPETNDAVSDTMVARFAELWLVEQWADYEFEITVEQLSRLWANAIGLRS
jgi:hypothetical protein